MRTLNKQFAFLSDIHFHDIYGKFQDNKFEGIPNSITGKNVVIRTMEAQLTSTRFFNENYFAFLQAMDDIVSRGIKTVILPGDLTDDGQPFNLRGIVKILNEYKDKYGLEYYATLGNHDPVKPYGNPSGKHDFLGANGKRQPIYSSAANYKPISNHENQLITSEEMRSMGYEEIMDSLSDLGFYPKEKDIYWETPFSTYNFDNYDFQLAKKEAKFTNRLYEICLEGSGGQYKKDFYTNSLMVPDCSYLVECEKDIWLLSIDANIFVPKKEISENNEDFNNYNNSSNAGYNKVITHKQFLLDWIKSVVDRAKKYGKTLIPFGHYPAVDFYEDSKEDLEKIFGKGKFQIKRVPSDEASKALAATGLKIQFGGHMHFNDTASREYPNGDYLINILIPSVAAYVPAYKVATLREDSIIDIETIILDKVSRFDELFEHYRVEYDYLKSTDYPYLWNKAILDSKSYKEFNQLHIEELCRLRFIPSDWPQDLQKIIKNLNGLDMLILTQLNSPVSADESGFDLSNTNNQVFLSELKEAKVKTEKLLNKNKLTKKSFEKFTAFDLIVDFYKLRNADQLSLVDDLSLERVEKYKFIQKCLSMSKNNIKNPDSLDSIFKTKFYYVFKIFEKLINGKPSINFSIDLKTGEIYKKK